MSDRKVWIGVLAALILAGAAALYFGIRSPGSRIDPKGVASRQTRQDLETMFQELRARAEAEALARAEAEAKAREEIDNILANMAESNLAELPPEIPLDGVLADPAAAQEAPPPPPAAAPPVSNVFSRSIYTRRGQRPPQEAQDQPR